MPARRPVNPRIGTFIHQARTCAFSNAQRPATAGKPLVYYEHVVVSVVQFDDSRVLPACAEALDCAFYPFGKRLDVATKFLLPGRIQEFQPTESEQ
jgi:hypothetical protein